MRLRIFASVAALALAAGCTDHPDTPTALTDSPLLAAGTCTLGVSDADATRNLITLRAAVDGLEAARVLNRGQANALRNHLDGARAKIEDSQYCPALSMLKAFRDQVLEFRADGVLNDRQMSPLLAKLRLIEPTTPLPGDIEEMYAPGAVGELRTIQVDGVEITFEIIDGLAIYQSDMILGYADEVTERLGGSSRALVPDAPSLAGACVFNHFQCERWSDATIGYDYAFDWSTQNPEMQRRIEAAILHWQQRTGIRFVRRSSGERLVFRNGTGCSSWIGRLIFTGAEPQWINLSTDCGTGAAIHEIGHAVGLFHEQSRIDRNSNVRIDIDRVQDGREHNFRQYSAGDGRDIGPYNFGSIMHYGCGAFARMGAGNTIDPIAPGVTCDMIGSRSGLTTGDILGIYSLYPPSFTITGASSGDASDRFTLGLRFDGGTVRSDFIVWTADRVSGDLGTGLTFSTGPAGLPNGTNNITASVRILGVTVAQSSITLTIANERPSVSLGSNRQVDLNRQFTVIATVSDTEDGACLPGVCRYTWSPTPETDRGGSATYRWTELGSRRITVTVYDGAGAFDSDAIFATAVNSAPVPAIALPTSGASYSSGALFVGTGSASDINEGGDPGPGAIRCSALSWSSSDPSDILGSGCTLAIRLGDAGVRTITLTATDPQGLSASTSVQVTATDCGANCPPNVAVLLQSTSQLDGSRYSPSFTGAGFYLTTRIEFTGTINDADEPPDNPMSYEWRLVPPCSAFDSSCPPETVLGSGRVTDYDGPSAAFFNLFWTPADDIAEWSTCVTTALPYTIRLRVTDGRGATNTATRTVHVACTLL